MKIKCLLFGHDLKILSDRKTLRCIECGNIAVMKKSRIDEAWAFFQRRRLIAFNETKQEGAK